MSRTPRPAPLLSLELQAPTIHRSNDSDDGEDEGGPKRWYHYTPVALIVAIALAPHPSILRILVNYHLQVLESPFSFGVHLLTLYSLTFGIFASLIVCISRDPGAVSNNENGRDDLRDANGDLDLTEALMAPEADSDYPLPGTFCFKCQASRPERAHHCSTCGRCILKMDHHCAWLATCVGHRTYPAFIHFLGCTTLFSLYVAVFSVNALVFAFKNPLAIDTVTPIHELFLSFAGIVFTLVIGAFFLYHVYLVSTNQSTLESLTPFMLLRYLPPPSPASPSSLSHGLSPQRRLLDENRMSSAQRRVIRQAHSQIFMYDLGWKRNWAQVMGWDNHHGHGLSRTGRKRLVGWVWRIVCGGEGNGDGRTFPRNPRAAEMLARLAAELQRLDKEQ